MERPITFRLDILATSSVALRLGGTASASVVSGRSEITTDIRPIFNSDSDRAVGRLVIVLVVTFLDTIATGLSTCEGSGQRAKDVTLSRPQKSRFTLYLGQKQPSAGCTASFATTAMTRTTCCCCCCCC